MARQSENHAGGVRVWQGEGAISRSAPATESGRTLRIAALIAVAIGLAALTAGACVLSYEHIHHLAIESGVSSRLASVYPLIFDALLILSGCSVLALRGAGLVSRVYAWLCLLVLLAALAGAGAVHAAGLMFTRKPAAVVAAVIPWVLVLIGFGLLLALLRHARLRRQASRSSVTEQLADPLPPESPDVVLSNRPVVPAPRPVPRSVPAGAGVQNPALAALAVARTQGEPATTPQPSVADLTKSGQPRPPAPQADLQLRARIPRPAPTSGRPPSAAESAAASAAASGPQADSPADDPAVASGTEPGSTEPGSTGPGGAGPGSTGPGGTAQEGTAAAPAGPNSSSANPAPTEPGSQLSPAPTEAGDEDKQGSTPGTPPAFWRQRSSPTPPDEE